MSMLHGIVSAARLARTGSQHGQPSAWPNGTTVSTHDILIEERSLTAHAHTRGTPCVLISHVGESDDSCDDQSPPLQVSLPRETSPGDLLALACRGTIAASQTRPHVRHLESADDEWSGRCMK